MVQHNGATIVSEPQYHHGDRRYQALDCGGHLRIFCQKLKEMTKMELLSTIVPGDIDPSSRS